ncbi:MAG: hypothetical protein LBS72_09650 [Oscillospiraceae bacterium]|jgi:plasmid maintenance system antidote protein VapI|nr:hypothetical protein [Oscillospiraceae bacterium]
MPLTTTQLTRQIERQNDLSQALLAQSAAQPSPFSAQLKEWMRTHRKNTESMANALYTTRTYVYQMAKGMRVPGRDMALRLAFLFGYGLDETQRLLRRLTKGALYPCVRRDAVIVFGLTHGWTLEQTESALLETGERSLVAIGKIDDRAD